MPAPTPMSTERPPARSLAALAIGVLDGDETASTPVPVPDPEVDERAAGLVAGEEAMSLRQVIAEGGPTMLAVLFALNFVDEFDRAAFSVLGPDIQRTLGLSDLALAVAATVSGLVVVLAAIPIGVLADRGSRTRLVALCSALWAAFGLLTGLVQNVAQLVAARTLSGVGKANEGPVQKAILADAYPIAGRSRVFAIHNLANPAGSIVGPVVAAAIVALVGGGAAWRWVFVCMAVPAVVGALVVGVLRDPARGGNEQRQVLGTTLVDDGGSIPISLPAAFARLRKVRTYYYALVGLGAVGFGVFTAPIFINLVLERDFGLSAAGRGVVAAVASFGGLAGAALGGVGGDRLARRSPGAVLVAAGVAIAVMGLSIPVSVMMPNVELYTVVSFLSSALIGAATVPVTAVFASVVPHRLRSTGFALIGVYLAGVGGVGGAIVSGLVSGAVGPRGALMIVLPPTAAFGGALIAYGARFVTSDAALVVADLEEEGAEHRRIGAGGEVPALQVRNLDCSYGPVKVLFGVDLDVRRGEVLALLGTNGAGKSTVLRALSGLAVPDRGVVRFGGRDITYADPSTRVGLGIVQVAGGKALFPDLTVRENLLAGGFTLEGGRALDGAIESVLDRFPILRDRLDQRADTLSGGEQQMLAVAKALLLEPEVLLIDELSLGLAPIVVEELLVLVEALRSAGVTIVIVEQSVNVALSVADRAIFMEKGEVRFEGPAADLAARDDLLRAVFLGEGRG